MHNTSLYAYLGNLDQNSIVRILEINFVSGSDGCCDCLYDDVSVECIVAANCRTNRVLVEIYCSTGSKWRRES